MHDHFNFADDSELGVACLERDESPTDWRISCKKEWC